MTEKEPARSIDTWVKYLGIVGGFLVAVTAFIAAVTPFFGGEEPAISYRYFQATGDTLTFIGRRDPEVLSVLGRPELVMDPECGTTLIEESEPGFEGAGPRLHKGVFLLIENTGSIDIDRIEMLDDRGGSIGDAGVAGTGVSVVRCLELIRLGQDESGVPTSISALRLHYGDDSVEQNVRPQPVNWQLSAESNLQFGFPTDPEE